MDLKGYGDLSNQVDDEKFATVISHLAFNEAGLIPVIVQDDSSGEVLMMAWMNTQALIITLTTGQVTYWSRSRQELWRKGQTSGHYQTLRSIATDCDADTLLIRIDQVGAACHEGTRSCFESRPDLNACLRRGDESLSR